MFKKNNMVKLIKSPIIIKAAGIGEKRIEEYIWSGKQQHKMLVLRV